MGLAKVFLVSLCSAVYLLVTTGAQQTNVVCRTEYDWFDNSKDQSPCLVAAELIAQCDPSRANVTALQPNGPGYYSGPNSAIGFYPTTCSCNTVMYSLLSACSVCRGYRYIEWSRWAITCQSVYITQYPKPIPDATAVPAWAYLNVAANGNNFSITAAASDTNLPDVTSSSATSAAVPVAPFATSPSIGPTESGGNNIGSSSANFIKNRVTTIVIPVVIGGGLVLTVVIGLAMRLRKKWKLRQQRGGGAGVAAIEYGETQTRGAVRGGSVSRGGMNLGVSVREHESTSTPPMEGGDSSEIQLVSRENADTEPSVRRAVGSRLPFHLNREEPVAGPSRVTIDS